MTVGGDMNRAYYGEPVAPLEIVEGKVQNPGSSELRKAASNLLKSAKSEESAH